MNGTKGLQAWRWMFIIEGAITGEQFPMFSSIRMPHEP
jgi:hypothetical protein